jgi:PBSX family phage terminase large subunit
MSYKILAGENVSNADYKPRGGCADLIYSHDPEVIAEGPAETGKTLASCWKLHLLASKYPASQWVIVRKTQRDLYGSVLQTWERVIKGAPVTPYGGEKPEKYQYSNGATVWVAGMDNPGKVLSSERDGMYVNQAEQLVLDDWESLTTRTTGRNAVVPHPQVFGDCNPAGAGHWIRERNKSGILRLIHTRHQDNPTLYNEDGSLTEQGKRSIKRLGNLTGVRRKRLFEGIWATAEGAVYDTFDASVHVMFRPDSEMVSWYLAMDEGYTNPAVILLIGEDADKRWHVSREWYERGKLESVVIEQAAKWYREKGCKAVAVDSSAAGLIAGLRNAGIDAHAAKGRVLDGIQHMQDRMKIQADGKPRYTVDPSCVNVINEKESYVWKQTSAGTSKDEPVKENDHANDAERYLDDLLSSGGKIELVDNPFDL